MSKPSEFKCDECEESFPTIQSLKGHCGSTGHPYPKRYQKPSTVKKATGVHRGTLFESIFFEGRPTLLITDNSKTGKIGVLRVVPEIKDFEEGIIVSPLEKDEFPYRPYSLTQELLDQLNNRDFTKEYLYQQVYGEFEKFLDLEPSFIVLETVQCLESHQQHKMMSTSYLFHEGDVGSGKTRALEIHNYLSYRPLFSVSLPPADVYSYLGYHDEATGTICEDEAHNLGHERYEEKMKIYRAGYRKGNTAPRIEFPKQGQRQQRFYKVFCSKVFAGYYVPQDKAFTQRCIRIPMMVGEPEYDEILQDDLFRFDDLKMQLLAWRMRTFFNNMSNVELPPDLKGRQKEVWKSKIMVAQGLPAERILWHLSVAEIELKRKELKTSLPAKILEAVLRKHLDPECEKPISFIEIWTQLLYDLNIFDTKLLDAFTVITPDGDKITKWIVGKQLGSLFGGKRTPVKGKGKCYTFEDDKLLRMARKYALVSKEVTELTEITEFYVCKPSGAESSSVPEDKNNNDSEQHQPNTQMTQLLGKDGKLSYREGKSLDDVFEEFNDCDDESRSE